MKNYTAAITMTIPIAFQAEDKIDAMHKVRGVVAFVVDRSCHQGFVSVSKIDLKEQPWCTE